MDLGQMVARWVALGKPPPEEQEAEEVEAEPEERPLTLLERFKRGDDLGNQDFGPLTRAARGRRWL